MDADLKSIASARRAAESAFEAYRQFLGTDPAQVDAIVDAMARAIEPEAKRLGELAVEETGYGNVPDKRVKNLFNALSVADYLRDVTTLGVLWRDDNTKIAAIGEPMGVIAALIPVTNPTSTIIYKILSAVKAGNAIVLAPHPRGLRCHYGPSPRPNGLRRQTHTVQTHPQYALDTVHIRPQYAMPEARKLLKTQQNSIFYRHLYHI